ncbi:MULTISPECIES: hypothetical protein [Streptomyces]|uniref:Uncharacterized protein n=1 Tax=Streptomyces doebereineriae TaxID=3075528 RepID=A0ABU2VD87_9ACTN|nr:hypothetical protein [Streptomyces sp. DSM 41640]MDT0483529.1 hypothetical protein [Streptomyces sp. DSM 41640]
MRESESDDPQPEGSDIEEDQERNPVKWTIDPRWTTLFELLAAIATIIACVVTLMFR